MNTPTAYTQPEDLTKEALQALKNGRHTEARRLALKAALQFPDQETPWLLLAALSAPRESVGFIDKALQINPKSERARVAMRWAVRRLREGDESAGETVVRGLDQTPEFLSAPHKAHRLPAVLHFLLSHAANGLLILLGIILLSLLGLFLSRQGQLGLPVDAITAVRELARQAFQYLVHHPAAYIWHKQEVPALKLALELFFNSAGLLLAALLFAILVGGLFGILAAVWRKRGLATLTLLVSIPGISTPSFLLAMVFWMLNVRLSNAVGLAKAFLPPTGFGWDLHMILPVLVLSARPLAQILQVTYVNMSEVLGKEYITVARARGASGILVLVRHALPNILIPVLTTLGTSLRFSLASLPVVECFFIWPGIGSAILQAINLDIPELVTDLVVSLGILFLVVNLGLDLLYLLIDPRQRKNGEESKNIGERALDNSWVSPLVIVKEWLCRIKESAAHRMGFHKSETFKLAIDKVNSSSASSTINDDTHPKQSISEKPAFAGPALGGNASRVSDTRFILQKAISNPLLILGTLMALAFIGLAIFGESLVATSPYQTHNIVMIDGKVSAPPFAPSQEFPWGSDAVGRDVRALVLAGARQTLGLALFATLARVLLGVVLGLLAGWWQNSWIDRLVHSTISMWAAFPVTIFAMILILALGIQKGMSVFIIAFCLVGWGEISQYVRGVVIQHKPMQYIEAARSLGAQAIEILHRHILPHLVPAVLVLTILEMGSVLMLLAELGFLNIFLGGGYKVVIGEGARMTPIFYFFSDVPEWGALLANILNWWRSYPWLAWYPGVFFFLSILAFNLWGEGMRRFIEESRLNISRFINRYTVIAAVAILVITLWAFRSATPIQTYSAQARLFNSERVLQDIQVLSSPEMGGRESGAESGKKAADYIAARMEEIGLFPAGQKYTFLREQSVIFPHLIAVPELALLDRQGKTIKDFHYREDFSEFMNRGSPSGEISGQVVGFVVGSGSGEITGKPVTVRQEGLDEKVLLIRKADLRLINIPIAAGLLVIEENEDFLSRRYLYPPDLNALTTTTFPMFFINSATAEELLNTAGSSLEQLDRLAETLKPDEYAFTAVGSKVRLSLERTGDERIDQIYDVIGFIPGNASSVNEITGQQLDSQVILISAYYDGLGNGPDGTLYPGANDNASGVAMMLEIARLLLEGDYKPDKTIVFAAWGEGERGKSFSVTNTMGAKVGFNELTVEAVIELSGVGAGSGEGIALDNNSSFRLISLFQEAARKTGASITTRGRGPHFGSFTRSDFGGRTALSAFVSWNGADELVHTPQDSFDIIDPEKIRLTGETTSLVVTLLARETEY